MYNTYHIHVIISVYLTNTYTHSSNDIVYMCIIMHVQISLKTHTYCMYVHYIVYMYIYNYAKIYIETFPFQTPLGPNCPDFSGESQVSLERLQLHMYTYHIICTYIYTCYTIYILHICIIIIFTMYTHVCTLYIHLMHKDQYYVYHNYTTQSHPVYD